MTAAADWRIHAHEPYWMPEADFSALMDWLHANRASSHASAAHDVTVIELDGQRVIHVADDDGHETTLPLLVDPPDIPRPDVPHLADLQTVLGEHLRGDVPAPALSFGDCLDEGHGGLTPGGGYCRDCSRSADIQYVAWPCRPVAEAATQSGVTLW